MNKRILSIKRAIKISQELKKQNKRIVLAGGCFDIIHLGHIKFLEAAKKQADILFLLLESDETIHKFKGSNRPINTQAIRAKILAALTNIDYIILLPTGFTNSSYDAIIRKLKPEIIATTKGDPNRNHKERQAKFINARVIDVVEHIHNQSSSKLADLLNKESL